MKYKTLYKQTTTGKVQEWKISVKGNIITTEYGLTDGKKQTTTDIIKEGKNLGRSNATTPETQAAAEAQQAYDAKLKEGYVADIKVAASTKNTLEAVSPMLAFPIEAKEKYAVFPALSQPKFDGLRCICILKDGKARLFSRTQKEFTTMPHIVAEVEKLFAKVGDIVLDGELYSDEFREDFNEIIHLIKRDDVHPQHTRVEYHVYDVVAEGGYLVRTAPLYLLEGATYLKKVETIVVDSREALEEYQVNCVERRYEGCMYRHPDGPYENKRSKFLLKVKTMKDEEFKIVGYKEGKGKLMNHIGCWVCELNDGTGNTVEASPAVPLEVKAQMWKDRDSYIGKWATIKFQGYTPDKSLRFPIWKALRPDGD